MSKRIGSLFKESQKQIRRLRKKIRDLKKEQEEEFESIEKQPKAPRKKKTDEVVVHFSATSVAKATLIVIGLVVLANFLGQIWDILVIFFVSILFAAALDPTVDALEKYKIPRGVSVIAIYLVLLILLGFFISQLIPLIATQLVELGKSLSGIINKFINGEANLPFNEHLEPLLESLFEEVDQDLFTNQLKDSLDALAAQLQSFAGNTLGTIKGIFNGVFNFFLVLFLTFFFVVDEDGVDRFFVSLFPSKHGKYIVEKMEAVKYKVGLWLRGQIIIMALMFVTTYLGLLILGVDYALTLGMIAGIAELVPVIGAFLAGIPAALVGFNQSPWLALWVIGLITVLQQLEGNIFVPMVMKKAVGLNPIVIILAMLIGYKTLGILGAIIAIPVTTSLSIFVGDYAAKKK